MIESPVLRELEAEFEARGEARGEAKGKADSIVQLLQIRFGALPPGLDSKVRAVTNLPDLDALLHAAAQSSSVREFQEQLR